MADKEGTRKTDNIKKEVAKNEAGLDKGLPEKASGLSKDVKKKLKQPGSKKPEKEEYNPWNILMHPHLAEKSMTMVELQNKLTFVVDKRVTKSQVAEAVERGFNVKVEKVNVEVTRKGLKKAYVKLSPGSSAADIATRLGMI